VIAVLIGAASWALGVCVAPRLQLPRDGDPRCDRADSEGWAIQFLPACADAQPGGWRKALII